MRQYICIYFTGQGQKEQEVINIEGGILLICHLPGKQAKAMRLKAVKLLLRYFAGDQTLHTEIEANAASTSPVSVLAREALGTKRGLEEGGEAVPQRRVKTRAMTMLSKMSGRVVGKMDTMVEQQMAVFSKVDSVVVQQTKLSEDLSVMLQQQTQMMAMMQTCIDTAAENARLKAQLEDMEASKKEAVERTRTEMQLKFNAELAKIRGREIKISEVMRSVLGAIPFTKQDMLKRRGEGVQALL
jgi:hypothetical protein